MSVRAWISSLAIVCACSSVTPPPPAGTTAAFDLRADLANQESFGFYAMPWPSDLRLTKDGTPDVRGFPNNLMAPIIDGLRAIVMQRKGFPQMPVAYFRFDAPIGAQDPAKILEPSKDAPVMLVDVDEKSPERGRLFPVVMGTPEADRYLPENVLEIAPRVGVVLHPSRTYAYVVRTSLNDAAGKALAVPTQFALMRGAKPSSEPELRAWTIHQPLWATLGMIGVDAGAVAVATVFTTGDAVRDTAELTTKTIAKHTAPIANLAVPMDGDQPRFCKLRGEITYPQFQGGTPPFDKDGLFDIGADGLPKKQRDETVPITIALPKGQPMPAGGYPFILYFHGSGGLSSAVVDAGKLQSATDEKGIPGEGPAFVMAPHGFAMAGSALPLNPERLPGAEELAYLNFSNPAAFRDTFRQGILEQRLFINALEKLVIDPQIVAACTGLSLPNGESKYRFDMTKLHAQGQSMGGMYTNLMGAIDPRVKIVVPTGAGGYWSFMVLTTQTIMGAPSKLRFLLGSGNLTFLHPTLHLLETAWEAAEPFVYMPRIAKEPLEGHPVRPIYEPVAIGDTYFSFDVYDGAALAYGNKQAGSAVWPSMQAALGVDKLAGILPYPVENDLSSASGTKYTGAVVQYMGDGVVDPHAIYRQLDAVKWQYACFHESWHKTGTASIWAPKPIDQPCGP